MSVVFEGAPAITYCNITNIEYTDLVTDKPKKALLLIAVSTETVRRVDELWHEYRMRSRSAMVRRLVEVGIEALEAKGMKELQK